MAQEATSAQTLVGTTMVGSHEEVTTAEAIAAVVVAAAVADAKQKERDYSKK